MTITGVLFNTFFSRAWELTGLTVAARLILHPRRLTAQSGLEVEATGEGMDRGLSLFK